MPNPVYVKQLALGPMANFVYLVGSTSTREVAVVDPAWDIDEVLRVAQEEDLKLTKILLTHFHYDHTNGVRPLLEKVSAQVYIHKLDLPYLSGFSAGGTAPEVVTPEPGQEIPLGQVTLTFLHTPGHTPGSLCFLVQDHLLTGDTLFVGACGRCDTPGGSPGDMYRSLDMLKRLDPRTQVLPGHDYGEVPTSTIEDEAAHNPFMQVLSLKEFLRLVPGPSSTGWPYNLR